MDVLFTIGRGLLMHRILIVAPTNNVVDFIEDRLLYVIPFFNSDSRRCEVPFPFYHSMRGELDIRNVPRANQLRQACQKRISMDIIYRFQQGITR